MIGFAQSVVLALTLVLTGVLVHAFRDPASISPTNFLVVFGFTFGGWVAISSWKELRLTLRRRAVVLPMKGVGEWRKVTGKEF